MCSPTGLARNSIEAQERMFRLAERDFGLSIRTLHLETRIPVNTLQGWRNGTTMPAWALGALGKAGIPDYLLSLVLQRLPAGDFCEQPRRAGGYPDGTRQAG
jgi:hypothetical protein